MKIDYISSKDTSVKCGIRKKDGTKLSLTLATLWTIACQVPLSMAFSRQEYGSEFAFFFSRGSSRPRNQTRFQTLQADSLPTELHGKCGMLLLLLSRFSRVQLCATPETEAHQVPPSLGFSREEHWSGLPFPSPMHESEK